MEIEIDGGLRVKINDKTKTASIIRSPKATGIILVPRFAEHNNIKYIITSIGNCSFEFNDIECLTFPEDSEVQTFETHSFFNCKIKKLKIPPKLRNLDATWCQFLENLTEIEISPQNHLFTFFEGKYLLGKSQEKSGKFDVLFLTRRDIVNAVVPANIKTIRYLAFNGLKTLKTVEFEPNSELECIEGYAFNWSSIEKLVVTSKSVRICSNCFCLCKSLSLLSFPDAEAITFDKDSMSGVPKEAKILVRRDVKLAGDGASKCQGQIAYIEGTEKPKKEEKKAKKDEDKMVGKSEVMTVDNRHDKRIEMLEKENAALKKYASFLQSRLSRYEEAETYDEFLKSVRSGRPAAGRDEGKEEEEEEGREGGLNKHFYGGDDEEFQEVVSKVGEGGTSEVFKVFDKRRGEVICKKVIKECRDESAFDTLEKSLREIEASHILQHPCICESLGFNTREELPGRDFEDENEEEKDQEKAPKTTVALFFEFLPFSVKEVSEKGLMSNTLKARIAVEVAFGMSHVHRRGMMHRDLKLENIMMNSVFESKIIDFGLVQGSDLSMSSSLTRCVGTLAYMSPEMASEEEYDSKTDVYSYGVVLFALFTGSLPKQSMRDRMTNAPMKYPAASSKISEFCIDLIKRCTSFESSSRPTFDEILEDMFRHSFCLAPEIDTKLVMRRYRELNRFRVAHDEQSKAGNK